MRRSVMEKKQQKEREGKEGLKEKKLDVEK